MTSEYEASNEQKWTRENAIILFSAADTLMNERDVGYVDSGLTRKLALTDADILMAGSILVKHNLEVADSASISFIREKLPTSEEELLISLRRDGIDTDYWVVMKDGYPDAVKFEKEVTSVEQSFNYIDPSGGEIAEAAVIANLMLLLEDKKMSEELGLNSIEPVEQKALIEIVNALKGADFERNNG